MPAPSEHKTVQARILQYAQEIGWTHVPFAETKTRRCFDPDRTMPEGGMRHPLMTAQIRVHDLDVDEFCSNLLQKLVVLCGVTGRAPRPRPRGNSGAGCGGNSLTTCARIWQQAVDKFSKSFRGL